MINYLFYYYDNNKNMTSKPIGAIQLGIIYIKDSNIKGLNKILNTLPLDKLGDQGDELLSIYLSICASYGRVDEAKIIIEAWKVVYPEEENIQILSKLVTVNNINLITLSFILLSYEDYTYIELMDDLMSSDNSPSITNACIKGDKIFGVQPYETYKLVKEHAFDMDNYRVEEYAITKMEETAKYAPIPNWVKNLNNKPLITDFELEENIKLSYVPFEIPTDEKAVELMTIGLTQNGISTENLEQTKIYLTELLSTSTRSEKIKLLRPIMENQANELLSGEKILFQIFGPANPLINQDLTLNTKSSKYGGCRMMLCDIFDFDYEFNYIYDWFEGVCEECHLRIRHKWHAIRKPRYNGGWVGSYCSWKCVRESILSDGQEPDLLTREMVNIFEKQINEIGIQDRLDNKL